MLIPSMRFSCPSSDENCPYWLDGECQLEQPWEDCDDYASEMDFPDESEWEDDYPPL